MRHSATFVKTAMSSALAVSLIAGASVPAFALVNDTSLVNTGDHVDVDATAQQESSTAVRNSNMAVVKQSVDIYANTGGNTASGNIGGSGISTGSIAATAQMGTAANSNTTMIAPTSGALGSTTITDVVNTGDDADIDVSTMTKQSTQVKNYNTAYVNQAFNTKASTGNNTANDNIGPTEIATGGIAVGGSLNTMVNENMTMLGMGSPSSSQQNAVVLTNTGDDADIDSTSKSYSNSYVKNYNSAKIGQLFGTHLKTGNNTANDGIGGSAVSSGSVMAIGELNSQANSNMTHLGSSPQAGMAYSVSDIVNTGDDLDTNDSTKSSQRLLVMNHNSLFEYKDAHIKMSTGYNRANDTIGSSLVSSGTANAGAQMESTGNENMTMLGAGPAMMLVWLAGLM